MVNGDDIETQSKFSRHSLEHLKGLVWDKKILAIDEAQKIDNIGLSLKLLVDNTDIKILVSGSASFDLANKLNEPLTGRTRTFWVYPLSAAEIGLHHNWHANYLYDYISNYLYGAFRESPNS